MLIKKHSKKLLLNIKLNFNVFLQLKNKKLPLLPQISPKYSIEFKFYLLILLLTSKNHFMKKYYLNKILLIVLLLCLQLNAQNANGVYDWFQTQSKNGKEITNLFATTKGSFVSSTEVKNATIFSLNQNVLNQITSQQPNRIELKLTKFDGSIVTLSLAKVAVTADSFTVKTPNSSNYPYQQGLHYRGIVNHSENTLASISFFSDDVIGLFADENGNYNLGKLEDKSGKYILYNDKDLNKQNPFECNATDDPTFENTLDYANFRNTTMLICKKVNLYWEGDYELYVKKGSSVTTTTNFLTALFAQMTTLYANDSINILLTSVFVWTSVDPYSSASSTTGLTDFQNHWISTNNNFGANFAMLVAYETPTSGNGGLAFLNPGYCANGNSYAYANISATYSNVPTYSWSAEVVTHETGHNLGSPHTHSCSWNGNNTAIDYCAPTYDPQYAQGTCADVGVPTAAIGGTIMSYCHLLNTVGIKFANGFGPQPKALIISKLNAATCITGDKAAIASYSKVVTGASAAFTNVSTYATSYLWNFGDGQTSIATSPSHVYTTSGTFNVCLSATNDCGTTQYCRTLTISPLDTASFANSDAIFSIFPNPAINSVHIKTTEKPINWSLKLYDTNGKLVFTKLLNDQESELELNQYASGIYLIEIDTKEKIIAKKILISK